MTTAVNWDISERDWFGFLDGFKWKQGEHVTLIGPTGGGKSTLARLLLPRRRYVLAVATKRSDPVIAQLKKDGDYEVVKHFDGNAKIAEKFVLDPPHSGNIRRTQNLQRNELRHAIETAYNQGGWAVYIDEGSYVCQKLGLNEELEMIWHTGRTLKVSLMVSVQRPVNIPLIAYSAASHVFFWRNTDEADLKRIGGIGGLDNKQIRATVGALDRHEVLYLNTRSGEMVKTKARIN